MGVLDKSNAAVPNVDGKSPSRRIYRFGVFELRTETGELSKNGIRIRLQTRPCQVLQALLEKPGELVTREELCARLWPSGTFVDFESGLNTATNRLRSALGDSADAPRYIETLPRLGYRFICPVTELNNDQIKPNATSEQPPSQEQNQPLTTSVANPHPARQSVTASVTAAVRSHKSAALAAFIVAIILLLTWFLHSTAAGRHAQRSFQQLTFRPGTFRASRVFAPDSYPLLVHPF